MFVTFGTASGSPDPAAPSDSQAAHGPGTKAKKKRAQVAQACDWCRVHRTKCDSSRPCKNCVERGGPCESSRQGEVRTFPHAFREIQRLASRVRELELELAKHSDGNTASGERHASAGSSTLLLPSLPPLANREVETGHGVDGPSAGSRRGLKPPKRLWEGIFASTTQSSPKQWYGPSSLFYFIGQMEAYMTRALQQPSTDRTIWFKAANKTLPTPPSEPDRDVIAGRGSLTSTSAARDGNRPGRGHNSTTRVGDYLNAAQEEYFLGLFWPSYHCSLQILDETAFRAHYRSLCLNPPPDSFRRPSALVDILVALCVQYGHNDVGPDGGGTVVCWRHYQRCRALLELEMERPTLATLQTLVFAIVYLCCGSFQNMAHQLLALAARVGQMLGFHLEPPASMPWPEKELRKRVWWTVYVLEGKTCIKLGRPSSIDASLMSCSLSADDHELALQSGSNTASVRADGSTVTCLTYTRQMAMLVKAGLAVYACFFDRCAEILGSASGPSTSLYDDPTGLDAAADFLERYMNGPEGLKAWVRDVPTAIKTQRVGDGVPFSTDLSRLDIEIFAPAWLQRQRLFLELYYHTLMVILHRPFIAFPTSSLPLPSPGSSDGSSRTAGNLLLTSGELTVSHASTAVRHSIAVTMLIHQVLTETDLLKGWQEAFQQQWNAVITMVGFLLAFPTTPAAADARTATGFAIEVFETFGRHFSVGGSAASATRELLSKADLLRGTGAGKQRSTAPTQLSLDGDLGNIAPHIVAPEAGSGTAAGAQSTGTDGQMSEAFLTEMSDEEMAAAVRDMLAGTMDMVYSVDSLQPMGGAFPGGFQMGPDPWLPGFF